MQAGNSWILRSEIQPLTDAVKTGVERASTLTNGSKDCGVAALGSTSREASARVHDAARRVSSLPPPILQDDGEAESSGQPFVKRYKNFQRYAAEQAAHGNSSLPVPIVSSPKGPEASRSIPLAVIIGVQASRGIKYAAWFTVLWCFRFPACTDARVYRRARDRVPIVRTNELHGDFAAECVAECVADLCGV